MKKLNVSSNISPIGIEIINDNFKELNDSLKEVVENKETKNNKDIEEIKNEITQLKATNSTLMSRLNALENKMK